MDEVTATWLSDKRWRHSYYSNDTLTKLYIETYAASMPAWMELTEKTMVYNANKQLVAIHKNDLNIPATVGIDSYYYHQGKLQKHNNYHLDIRDILIPNTYLGYEFNSNLDTIATIK